MKKIIGQFAVYQQEKIVDFLKSLQTARPGKALQPMPFYWALIPLSLDHAMNRKKK